MRESRDGIHCPGTVNFIVNPQERAFGLWWDTDPEAQNNLTTSDTSSDHCATSANLCPSCAHIANSVVLEIGSLLQRQLELVQHLTCPVDLAASGKTDCVVTGRELKRMPHDQHPSEVQRMRAPIKSGDEQGPGRRIGKAVKVGGKPVTNVPEASSQADAKPMPLNLDCISHRKDDEAYTPTGSDMQSMLSRTTGSGEGNIVDEDLLRKTQAIAEGHRITNVEDSGEDVRAGGIRSSLRWLVETTQYELLVALIIVANSVIIGFEAERRARHYGDSEGNVIFFSFGTFFNATFLLELLLRIVALGTRFVTDEQNYGWNLLDIFTGLGSIIEMGSDLLYLAMSADKHDETSQLTHFRVVRVARVARLARTFRVTRVIRFVSALRTLVFSIFVTLKSLVWAMLLLLLIMYVFGILFTEAVSEHLYLLEKDPHRVVTEDELNLRLYWRNLSVSVFTLFKAIANGVSWHDAVECLGSVSVLWQASFCVYIGFVYFAVLNVVTAIFCNSAIEMAQSDPDIQSVVLREARTKYENQIKGLFQVVDSDGSGFITIQEFEECLEFENVRAYFSALSLDVEDAWMLFKLLDTDGTNAIDVHEFVEGVLRLRGHAKGVDVAKIMYDNLWIMKKLAAITDRMDGKKPKKKHMQSAEGDESIPALGIVARSKIRRSLQGCRQTSNSNPEDKDVDIF